MIENSSNLIGGPNVGDRNVISGQGLGAVRESYVPDQASNPLNITPTGNVIENNYHRPRRHGDEGARQQ